VLLPPVLRHFVAFRIAELYDAGTNLQQESAAMMPRLIACVVISISSVANAAQDDTVLGKKCGEWLTILKEHKEAKYRRASLIALEVFGPKTRGVLAGVEEALEKDTEPEIRREAALLLGRMGADAKEAVPNLAEALKKDKADLVREAAALALGGKLNDFAHEQVLVIGAALKDSHAGTRAASAAALSNLGEKARLALPMLVEVVKDKKADRVPRLYAVQIVSRLQADQAETGGLLVGLANDADAPVSLRIASIDGIGRLEKITKTELDALGQALQHKQVDMRRAAATVLAMLGEQAAPLWPQVQARLMDEDNTVRYQLIRVAGAVARDHKDAVTSLADLALKDAHVENRLAAIGELGQLGPAAAAAGDTLASIAQQDARAALRDAAAAALKKIRP
jgi:HEAT repeats